MASGPKAFALSEGEAELGRRESVVLKKQPGQAIVTTKRLVWTPNASGHMASVAGSQQCLLKVMTEVAGKEQAIVFVFESSTKESDRDFIRDLISSALASQSSTASSSAAASSSQSTQPVRAQTSSSASVRVKSEPVDEPAPKRRKITDETNVASSNAPAAPAPPTVSLTGTRKVLYEQDADLRDVYNQVVSTGIISDEEFWASRQALIKETERKMRGHADGDVRQRRGISSELATDLQPVKQEGGSVHFRLTPAIIHQIFVDHPAVHRAYKEYVPQKMSEKEFWTKYLQSQYFKKQQTKDTDASKSSKKDKEKEKSASAAEEDMFSRLTLNARDEQRELQEQVAAIDPTLNLAKEVAEEVKEDDEIDYIEGDNENAQTARALVRRERERRKKSQQLIKRFNRHGQLVLDSFSRFDRDEENDESVVVLDQDQQRPVRDDETNADSSKRQSLDDKALESRRQLFEEKTVIHDLEAPATSSSSADSALARNRSNLRAELIKDDPVDLTAAERKSRLSAFQKDLDSWNPGPVLDSVISIDSSISAAVSKELFPASRPASERPRSRDDSGAIVLDATEEDEVLQQLKGQLRTVNELLQHFWVSLQSNKPTAADKLSRIADALRKHQVRLEETLFNFKTVEPIAATISIAVEPIERALKTLRLAVNTPKAQR